MIDKIIAGFKVLESEDVVVRNMRVSLATYWQLPLVSNQMSSVACFTADIDIDNRVPYGVIELSGTKWTNLAKEQPATEIHKHSFKAIE